jgi:hypothetical protein
MEDEAVFNILAVYFSPSREEALLSDHVFSFFGLTITVACGEDMLATVVLAVGRIRWPV